MSVYGGTITQDGRDLLAGLVAGQTIEFTKVQFGSGIVPDQTSLETVTELYNYVADGSSNIPIALGNAIHLVAEYRNEMNPDMQDVFWINEFGIFAKTDSSPEVMIYYASLGETPQPVNPYADQRIDVKRFPVTIAIAIEPNIKLAYNPGTFITEENVDLKVQAAMGLHTENRENPHSVNKEQVGLGKVDNTPDSEKSVNSAQTASIANKLANGFKITLDGGSTEGYNQFTFDGSAQKTINITPKRLGAVPALESANNPGCYYRAVNGETEWINPPMELNVEYRTAERFMGNVVYTKVIKVGTIQSSQYGSANNPGGYPIRYDAIAINSERVYVSPNTDNIVDTKFSVSVDSKYITWTASGGLNNTSDPYDVYVRIWYIKAII